MRLARCSAGFASNTTVVFPDTSTLAASKSFRKTAQPSQKSPRRWTKLRGGWRGRVCIACQVRLGHGLWHQQCGYDHVARLTRPCARSRVSFSKCTKSVERFLATLCLLQRNMNMTGEAVFRKGYTQKISKAAIPPAAVPAAVGPALVGAHRSPLPAAPSVPPRAAPWHRPADNRAPARADSCAQAASRM